MIKNVALLFFFSFSIGNPSVAGGWFSKAQPEKWIAISKPEGEELLLWKWLSEKYRLDQIIYEEDIEFALPKNWVYALSLDNKPSTVKNDQGLVLFSLIESQHGSPKAIFFKKNIEILQKTFKN